MNISKLKFYVDKSGMSIREICRKVNITNPTYYKAIRDNDIQASVLEKFCIILKVSPMEFFEIQTNGIDKIDMLEESTVMYKRKTEDLHMGKLIEKRLDEINMTLAEFGRRIGTTRQNAKSILERKNITLEHAIEYNEVLNPKGSEPWDIFEYFLRKKPETIQDKYVRLLEDYNRLQVKTTRKNNKEK